MLFLLIAATVAGWVDSIAGGGGLITVPALMLTGLAPATVLATNKLQGSFGTLTAVLFFLREGKLSIGDHRLAILCVACGAIAGGYCLTLIDAAKLRFLIPVMLIIVAVYFWRAGPQLDQAKPPKQSAVAFNTSVAPCLGFYDGFFGPGTGSLFTAAYVHLRGFKVIDATAHTKLLNFTSNLSALCYFLLFGELAWTLGAVMIVGQILGAYLGSHIALSGGAKIIRPILITVCIVTSLHVLWTLQ